MLVEVAVTGLLVCALAAIFFAVRRAIRGRPKSSAELFTVIAATGDAAALEQTVRDLLWLTRSGRMKTRIVIADCGLCEQTRKLAELLAGDFGNITLCTPVELPLVLEENGWSL